MVAGGGRKVADELSRGPKLLIHYYGISQSSDPLITPEAQLVAGQSQETFDEIKIASREPDRGDADAQQVLVRSIRATSSPGQCSMEKCCGRSAPSALALILITSNTRTVRS